MQKYVGVIILMMALGSLVLAEASAGSMSSAQVAQVGQATQTETSVRVSAVASTMNIVYVNASVSGGANNGSSWADAYPKLQDALSDTTGVDEIWVASGVYYPDEGTEQTDNDRNSTFQLKTGVEIYGGFAATETLRTERDFLVNITVLSGDIDHDVMGNEDTNKDANGIIPATSDIVGSNAYNIVTGHGTDSTAVLDGFTINAGNANFGVGLSCLKECGGGIYNKTGSPTLTNVTITANSAYYGGGMYNRGSSNPMLTNVTISANSASSLGGGMFNTSSSNPTLTNVTITANSASLGGGMHNRVLSKPMLTNVIIWNNKDQNGMTSTSASIFNSNNGNSTISYSLIANSGGSAAWVPALGINGGNNIDDDPMFVEDGDPNTLTNGDYRLQLGSPAIDAGDNDADLDADGSGTQTISNITTDLAGNPRIQGAVVDMGAYEGDAPEIDVRGAGMSISDGDTTPSTLDDTQFGDVLVGQSMTHTFTISNSGRYSLTVNLPLILSHSTDFAISIPPSDTIPPQSSSSFAVIFTPSTTGNLSSTLSIATDDTDENPFIFVLGGTGGVPEIDVQGAGMSISDGDTTPSMLDDTDFGDVLVGEGMTHTFTISNTGSYSLMLNLPLTLSNTSDFAVSLPATNTIPVSGSISFDVTFTPSTTSNLSSTLSIGSNDSDESTFTFVVSGTGIAPEIDVQGAGMSISSRDTTPSTLDNTEFGDAVVLSDTISHTFTISNSGSYSLTLSGTPKVSLSTVGTFTVTSQPTSPIPAGGTSSFVVAFAPTTTGTHTTTVSINSDDTDEPNYTFDIQGTGGIPEISVLGLGISIANGDMTPSTQDNTDFGDVLVGQGMTHTFTIRNTGSYSLTLDLPFTLSNSTDFAVSLPATDTIPVSGSISFDVIFTPKANASF